MKTHPVSQKLPNVWGLYDIHGNAAEWVSDFYGLYPFDSVTDPKGAATGPRHTYRGGDWNSSDCRTGARSDSYLSSDRHDFLGFRVVRER